MLFLCAASFLPNVKADSEMYAQGSGFQIYADGLGSGLGFQMEKGVFTMEVLSGTLNGTDASLGLLYRGGNLYFLNNELCYVTFYHSATEQMGLTVDVNGASQRFAVQPGIEYNWTLPASATVYLTWSYALTMPHEENFMLYIGLFGIGLLVAGIFLVAYALRHYVIFTLDNKETIWDKDVLPVAIACLIFGVGLTLAWLLQGAV